MPQDGDIIRVRFITEIVGVQTSSVSFWEIQDLGDDDPVSDNLLKLYDVYAAAWRPPVTNKAILACVTYENLSRPEPKSIVFGNTTGAVSGSDSHPQSQVARINRYGKPGPGERVVTSAFNVSGIVESLSTKGRINNPSILDDLRLFLSTQQILIDNGWTIIPRNQHQLTPPPAATYSYIAIDNALVNRTLLKLRSRTTTLCGNG